MNCVTRKPIRIDDGVAHCSREPTLGPSLACKRFRPTAHMVWSRPGRKSKMSSLRFAFAALFAFTLLTQCAGTSVDVARDVAGDENGGKIPNAIGTKTDQTAAYRMVTAHCEKFGKKGFITKMDYDTGTISFECRLMKGK